MTPADHARHPRDVSRWTLATIGVLERGARPGTPRNPKRQFDKEAAGDEEISVKVYNQLSQINGCKFSVGESGYRKLILSYLRIEPNG